MTTLPDMLPLERPLIGLDLETTDTNPTLARIVELGLEIMTPDKPTKEFQSLINPGVPIPIAATEIHGITDEMVAGAIHFQQLTPNLLKGFKDADFVGYNIRFDLRVLAAEFKRLEITWSYDGARILDAYRVWQIIETRSLEDAAEHWLGVMEKVKRKGRDGPHGAMFDTRLSTLVLASQLVKHEQVPRTVQGIHDLCWPGWFDGEGKLKWRNGELCLAFGEHRDRPLRTVNKGYLNWMIHKDFSNMVKDACRNAIQGIYPSPVVIDDD